MWVGGDDDDDDDDDGDGDGVYDELVADSSRTSPHGPSTQGQVDTATSTKAATSSGSCPPPLVFVCVLLAVVDCCRWLLLLLLNSSLSPFWSPVFLVVLKQSQSR